MHLEKTKSERTTITYLNAIKSFLKKLQLPSHKLIEVSSADLYQYADSSELSSTSLLTHFSALRHFYRFLARRGYLQKEKYSEIEETIEDIKEDYGLKTMHRKPKALSKSELEKIFQKVKGSKYENIYKLFLYSGVRLSEYKNLSSEHFFLDKSGIYWLHLPAEITKRKKRKDRPTDRSHQGGNLPVYPRALPLVGGLRRKPENQGGLFAGIYQQAFKKARHRLFTP